VTAIEAGAVVSGGRRVQSGCVICAAGPWSAEVGAMAGVELPVRPELRRIGFTGEVAGMPEQVPMTIDF
jgi:sarcosine oxidase, subunit beta